jgi:hypothetical protein
MHGYWLLTFAVLLSIILGGAVPVDIPWLTQVIIIVGGVLTARPTYKTLLIQLPYTSQVRT